MAGINRVDSARLERASVSHRFEKRPGGAMGAVIIFPEARRAVREGPVLRLSATVIILPVVRIMREDESLAGAGTETGTETTKSRSGRKRRRPASRP
jgi:hypothetical protein